MFVVASSGGVVVVVVGEVVRVDLARCRVGRIALRLGLPDLAMAFVYEKRAERAMNAPFRA